MRFSSRTLIAGIGSTVALVAVAVLVGGAKNESVAPDPAVQYPKTSKASRPARPTSNRTTFSLNKEEGRRLYGSASDKAWLQISGSLTPSAAREMLERDRLEEKNIEVRAEKAWRIINQLCQNGFSKEAWEMIEPDPGVVRQKSLNGFFRDSGMPKAELMGMLDGLEKKDRAMGLSGYWDRFAPEEFVRLDMNDFEIRSPEEKAALRQSLEAMIAQAFDRDNPEIGKGVRQELLNMAADQVNGGVFAYSDFGKMIQQDPSKDGFAYWDAMARVDPDLRKGQDTLKGADAQVIRAMTTQDPERTLNMTLVDGSVARGKGYVALEKWLTQDYRKAEEWYQRNRDKADADSSAVAFMRACATLGEYQKALDWYAVIKSEGWQKGIGGEMRSIQRRLDAGE